MSIIGIISVANAADSFHLRYRREAGAVPSYTPDTYEQAPVDSYELPPQLPLTFELPREEPASVPFYSPEPSTDLRAPQYVANVPDYYQSPIPSQELVAPVETQWNPNNDPKFYYEVPALLTKQQLPTNAYPKKYNKDLHSKEKPYSSKPKTEITLEPINEAEYILKQKDLHKSFEKLAKKENQKQIQVQTTPSPVHTKLNFSDTEPDVAASDDNAAYQTGLSAEIVSSAGIPVSLASGEERVDFHLVGHAGPYSYKWGYDTGKG